ncbi:MAG: Gfo/Idh/MocA family oxidoreductase, partial [Caldilineaceae bacterium]|nr:Gfo/Idh/MocA family oxidoreductase [Caldilineaceae bacterium]
GGTVLTYERGEYAAAQAEASWEVIGETGSLRLQMTPAPEKEILQFEATRSEGTVSRTLWSGSDSYSVIHRGLLDDFATAIRTGRPSQTTLTQALLVQQITDAMYRSAKTGEAVEISAT